MGQEFQENGFRFLEDITQKVMQEIKTFHDFPNDLKINKAVMTLEPDGLSGSLYYITLEYEFDTIQYVMKRPIYTNLKSSIIDIIFEIVHHYRRMYLK